MSEPLTPLPGDPAPLREPFPQLCALCGTDQPVRVCRDCTMRLLIHDEEYARTRRELGEANEELSTTKAMVVQLSENLVDAKAAACAPRIVQAAMADWLPTPSAINALPTPLRQYIHNLETRCDPAGDTAALTLERDRTRQLAAALVDQDSHSIAPRIVQLARDYAHRVHVGRARSEESQDGHRFDYFASDDGFSTCPHPDCVLVRVGPVEGQEKE